MVMWGLLSFVWGDIRVGWGNTGAVTKFSDRNIYWAVRHILKDKRLSCGGTMRFWEVVREVDMDGSRLIM